MFNRAKILMRPNTGASAAAAHASTEQRMTETQCSWRHRLQRQRRWQHLLLIVRRIAFHGVRVVVAIGNEHVAAATIAAAASGSANADAGTRTAAVV